MPNVARNVLLSAVLMLPASVMATDETWGAWTDDSGINIYEFLPNHQFRYSGIEKVFVKYQGGNPIANLPSLLEIASPVANTSKSVGRQLVLGSLEKRSAQQRIPRAAR